MLMAALLVTACATLTPEEKAARDAAVKEGVKAVIVVDEISHGRDIRAAIDLVEKQGGKVIKISGFVEDCEENARKKVLRGCPVESRLFTEDF